MFILYFFGDTRTSNDMLYGVISANLSYIFDHTMSPRYNLNIVESGIKHHKPNLQ
jgi:hypothetical protein